MAVDPDRAEASAACGMQTWLPYYLPAEKYDDLKELLFDLVYSAIHAYGDPPPVCSPIPVPSVN